MSDSLPAAHVRCEVSAAAVQQLVLSSSNHEPRIAQHRSTASMTASTPSINRTLAQARTLNARLNAFTHIRDDLAASAAPAPTARTRPSSSGTSSLEGWAVAAKDNFCTLPEDGPTTAASRMLQGECEAQHLLNMS